MFTHTYYLATLNRSDQNKLIGWMKQVHISPKLNQRKQGINEKMAAVLNSAKSVVSDDIVSIDEYKENYGSSMEESTSGEMMNAMSIYVKEGLDRIVNVLNNVITLHKRVTSTKNLCTPSKRFPFVV